MKQKLLFLFGALLLINLAFAKPVDPSVAKLVGQNFVKTRVNSATISSNPNLELIYTESSKASGNNAVNYFFVFNVNENQGFVIVAADDIVSPVLGYSDEKAFIPNNIPVNVAKWLEGYKNEIRFAITNHWKATDAISEDWIALQKGTITKQKLNKKATVNPLVQTKWDQTPYYNALCPYDNSAGARTVTGCVATAMAQVMKFWNFPSSGTSFHSYNHSKYGTLSANFGSTTYDWSSMPTRITSSNSAIATLMYHCGVSVEMNYGVASKGGSGAYVVSAASAGTHCAEYALKTYFGYNTSLQGILRSNFTQSQWMAKIKGEFDNGRPVIYAGFGTGGGHCFVSDGYDNNDYLHFNWGWDGSYDGYFSVNALNPGGTGTGGGNGGFNSNHQAVIGIQPPSGNTSSNLDITVDVSASNTNVNYGSPFSITTNITNKGSGTFKGTYCAALFDAEGKFVEYVDSLVESSGLPANYTYSNNLSFDYAGSFTLLPGKYSVYIFYKPVGGNWKQIHASNTSIYDNTDITIKYASNIEMYKDMALSPTEFVKGSGATVNLNLINKGSTTFKGDYALSLFNLDGSFAETIATINEINGLPYNYTYSSPFLNFATTEITSDPGTYLLAIQYKATGASSWTLVGSSYYLNPIKVTIADKQLTPDKYEVNNSVANAYNLNASFSNNIAKLNTSGSNCHVGTDYDYYKINLPSGYNYTIKAELFDAYNDNGSGFTLDGLFSYSTDGSTWSDTYDDKMPSDITVNGGGTLYFLNSPYFTGDLGTYMLDFTITRTSNLSPEKDIIGFSVPGMVGSPNINPAAGTVSAVVSSSTSLTSLSPTIAISSFASISPGVGIARNFTNPVNYTVTAQDNSTKLWTITITKQTGSVRSLTENAELVEVYPNPVNDVLQISFETVNLMGTEVQIMDMQGKVLSQTLQPVGSSRYQLNMAQLRDGVYIIKIPTDKGIISKKVMVVK
jgi:hypothetical protein